MRSHFRPTHSVALPVRCRLIAWTIGLTLMVFSSVEGTAEAVSPYIVLGPQQSLPDQPYVTVELFTEDVAHPGQWISLGPDDDGWFLMGYNSFLLDTGANSILAVDAAAQSLESNGYQTQGQFFEMGVGGATVYDVSAPYRFVFTGTDGIDHILPKTADSVRIQSNPYTDLGGPVDSGGIPGLVGMPAMLNRVTTLDFSGWSNMESILDFAPMGVTFSDTLPSGNGHRYSVAVDNRIAFSAADGRPDWEEPDSPLPTYADVPFMTAIAQHHDGLGGSLAQSGSFLLDTGAQFSVISRSMAFRLGMDTNHDGDLNDEAIDYVEVGGVGGTQQVPILLLDEFRLPTQQGVDLVWKPTDPEDLGLQMIVMDILPCADVNGDGVVSSADADVVHAHWGQTVKPGDLPSGDASGNGVIDQDDLDMIESQLGQDVFLDGVFGVDLLTAGVTFNMDFSVEGDPYFQKVRFDFRDMDQGAGTIYFDLSAGYDHVIIPPLPGDANGDGTVDGADAAIVASHWHAAVAGGAADGDFNGDGTVDDKDVSIQAAHWTQSIVQPLGDANGDGLVNDADAAILASHWHSTTSGAAADGDFNGDGTVDDKDASILAAHWTTPGETAPSVPEPGAVTLLIAGGLFLAFRRMAT